MIRYGKTYEHQPDAHITMSKKTMFNLTHTIMNKSQPIKPTTPKTKKTTTSTKPKTKKK
jgi:hypothetical protein